MKKSNNNKKINTKALVGKLQRLTGHALPEVIIATYAKLNPSSQCFDNIPKENRHDY